MSKKKRSSFENECAEFYSTISPTPTVFTSVPVKQIVPEMCKTVMFREGQKYVTGRVVGYAKRGDLVTYVLVDPESFFRSPVYVDVMYIHEVSE